MHKFILPALALACCLPNSGPATAAVVKITEDGAVVASWEQSLTPTPLSYQNDYFTLVSITNAFGLSGDPDKIAWYSAKDYGGLTDYNGKFNILGIQQYTGSESMPQFTFGVFRGFNAANGKAVDVIIAVPEPAVWVMTICGFGMVGWALRRRPKAAVASA